jgi:TBC1 domain family protein 5
MLLLKYPAPVPPHGPQTFVEDAMFLRDNFSPVGGAKIISKYSGKSPAMDSAALGPLSPLSHRRSYSGTKSPLSSPARFLQQQGGLEALFQGAAKGAFERGERLGINKAVRDAVGEVKKGLQASRSNSTHKRASDVARWSLDEGKTIPSTRVSISAMKARNKQLAHMLEQAMFDLRAASNSPNGDKESYVRAMDLAIAKVDFIRIYLEDNTMPLPDNIAPSPQVSTPPLISPSSMQVPAEDPLHTAKPEMAGPSEAKSRSPRILPHSDENAAQLSSHGITPSTESPKPTTPLLVVSPNAAQHISKSKDSASSLRPKAPVPTRSSIAQSSFSWMLEPDVTSEVALKSSTSSTSSSPFQKSGRRGVPSRSREKTAFLFGEDGDEAGMNDKRQSAMVDAEDSFNLGVLKGSKSK